jgi:uncharacterized protein YeeX (DUF496 family)
VKNPNEYNDAAYAKAELKLMRALRDMWEAGAEVDNIEGVISDTLDDYADEIDVTIDMRSG